MKTRSGAAFLLGFVLLGGSDSSDKEWDLSHPSREHAPKYLTIPAADPSTLTPANGQPARDELSRWTRSHGAANMRYSNLEQINRKNVGTLKVAWVYHSQDGKANIQCNPIVADGVMYAPTAGDHVVAIDAQHGKELWRFRPEGHPAQRGLTYWPGRSGLPARILFLSGRFLYAVDAKTGKPTQGFGEEGRVALSPDPLPAGIGVVAPAVFGDVLVTPYMSKVKGLRIDNGELLWQFDLIPRNGDVGHDTWSTVEKGVNVWGGMAMDDQRGIVYVATGSPHPNMIGIEHRGRNLFANCVVALDAKTGKRRWHFQEIRHDIWDLDLPAPPVLVTVQRGGKRVDAVAQVTKLGNTLLLDRLTGTPLFPFRLRRAPESALVGEETWPYQPDLELPQPFARQVFTRDDVTDLTPDSRAHILKKIENANYGWFQPFELDKPTVYYGIHGGAEWTGASFDPATGWLYVSANELPWIITVIRSKVLEDDSKQPPTPGRRSYLTRCSACHGARAEGSGMAPPLMKLSARYDEKSLQALITKGRNAMPAIRVPGAEMNELTSFLLRSESETESAAAGRVRTRYGFSGFNKLLDQDGYPGSRPPWGSLNAIDLNTGKLVWKVPLGEYDVLKNRGVPRTGTENFGGAATTAGGLVFCAGTRDHKIRAFDKETGSELWSHELPWGGYAPPSIYSAGGKQYVVIAATGGGKLGDDTGDAYVAFALP